MSLWFDEIYLTVPTVFLELGSLCYLCVFYWVLTGL